MPPSVGQSCEACQHGDVDASRLPQLFLKNQIVSRGLIRAEPQGELLHVVMRLVDRDRRSVQCERSTRIEAVRCSAIR
jgi:hypothetical protein